MNKIEFIEGLKAYLEPEVDAATVRENVEYYRNYISDEMSKGKTEEEVVNELGDPWVIARTIIDMYDGEAEEVVNEQTDSSGSSYRSARTFRQDSRWSHIVQILLTIFVLVMIFIGVAGLVQVLVPILAPILLIVFVYRWFKD